MRGEGSRWSGPAFPQPEGGGSAGLGHDHRPVVLKGGRPAPRGVRRHQADVDWWQQLGGLASHHGAARGYKEYCQ
jgi:hypothetical protein